MPVAGYDASSRNSFPTKFSSYAAGLYIATTSHRELAKTEEILDTSEVKIERCC